MYSILVLFDNGKWCYLKDEDDAKYVAATLQEVQAKVKELARIYPLNELRVVKNCTITEDITVTEDGNSNTEDNGEIDPIKNNTTDSTFLFDNENAIVIDIHNKKKKNEQ